MTYARQHILFRRDSAANWTAQNPVLLDGEPGYETDTRKMKVGNGVTAWNALPYSAGGGSLEGLSDVNAIGKADGSVIYYNQAQNKFYVDSDVTKLTITDGGNF
jgi:hypothetical protein